jgi:two-component system, NarL family, response regulator DegU
VEGKIRVFIVSSNRLLRESIAHVLANKKDFEVLAAESPVSSTAASLPAVTPDVWVSDSLQCLVEHMPHRTERNDGQPTGCVLVAMQDNPKHFLTAVSWGVQGYVLQEASAIEIVAAVRAVANGQPVCPARLARVLFDYVASQGRTLQNRARKQFKLTRREQQLIPLVDRGLTNKEIAAELSVSEQTVKSHIHRMLRKMGVEDRFAISAACNNITQMGTTP